MGSSIRVTLLLALVLVPASAAASAPTPGIDRNGPDSRLAWFDPATMKPAGKTLDLSFHIGSWSFSPDRSKLAIAGSGGISVRFVDLAKRRVIRDLELTERGDETGAVTWVRPDRLVAYVRDWDGATLVRVDPAAGKVLQREPLDGTVYAKARSADGIVLLVAPLQGIGPARLVIAAADGPTRVVKLDRITAGLRTTAPAESRAPGLAVDPAGTAYVVDANTFAVVDLHDLSVSYRSQPRQLAKAMIGSSRTVAWLGSGAIAVSGADYDSTGGRYVSTPAGLRVVDVGTWTARTLSTAASGFQLVRGLLLAGGVAYDRAGNMHLGPTAPPDGWLNLNEGRYVPVCTTKRALIGVVDLATGAQTPAKPGARCADLLTGPWSRS